MKVLEDSFICLVCLLKLSFWTVDVLGNSKVNKIIIAKNDGGTGFKGL